MTVEAPRTVACRLCGFRFELSARRIRDARARGQKHVCVLCRRPEKPADPAVIARMRAWWLERFTLEELVELGRGWATPEEPAGGLHDLAS